MKKRSLILALALALRVTLLPISSMAENADVTGKVVIYTSMYQDIIDMMDELWNFSLAAPVPCKPSWPARWKSARWDATC